MRFIVERLMNYNLFIVFNIEYYLLTSPIIFASMKIYLTIRVHRVINVHIWIYEIYFSINYSPNPKRVKKFDIF